MADEKTDKPSGRAHGYFVRAMFEDDPFEQMTPGLSRDVYVIPAHVHRSHGLGGRCLLCEGQLWESEQDPFYSGLPGAIQHAATVADPLMRGYEAAREILEAEQRHLSGLPLKMRSHVFESWADVEAAADEETQDKPSANDDERLEEIREALEKSRELGKRAQSGIDALVERSH